MKYSTNPPPLVAMGMIAHQQRLAHNSITTPETKDEPPSAEIQQPSASTSGSPVSEKEPALLNLHQINSANQEGGLNMETLSLTLSAVTAKLTKLKEEQKQAGEGSNPELDAAVANQMRLLIWLNCLVREAGKRNAECANDTTNSTTPGEGEGEGSDQAVANMMQMGVDHEGEPEWKCLSCEFRDSEKETVMHHIRLAHGKKGPVSLVHAVHRCSVCGFAAGTKRHVQLHLDTAHNGQGGIISKSEGQNLKPAENCAEEKERSFHCRMCPFSCSKRSDLKSHLNHHTPRSDYIFKCMFCPYYVANKSDLFSHLIVHGMALPDAVKQAASNGNSTPMNTPQESSSAGEENGRQFVCDLCPFETRSRAKLMHHRQFHRPRGLPFSCPHCSYNVTRRHLLSQHLRIHGVSPTDSLEPNENVSGKSDMPFSRSKSPSPSLTITPIGAGLSSISTNGNAPEKKPPSHIDPACLPIVSDELTKNLHEIPLVWVSRDRRYYKLFKCRHCPHVNSRKGNIQEHEKMHRNEGTFLNGGHYCHLCTYSCVNAGVLTSHLKVHGGALGTCHAIVDPGLRNEEQLELLAGSFLKKSAMKKMEKADAKMLYYCQKCPARFFLEKEIQIHTRFHNYKSSLPYYCPSCNFGARDEAQLLAHNKVHTPEYQERTKTLITMHPSSPSFPPVAGITVPSDVDITSLAPTSQSNSSSNVPSVATSSAAYGSMDSQPPPATKFKCDQCPSSFSKLITLQYHQSLHSADNPHRCHRCSYAAKTEEGLQSHVALHEKADADAAKPASSHLSPLKTLQDSLGVLNGSDLSKDIMESIKETFTQPPIKMKLIGMKDSFMPKTSKQQFKYYIEEQVPLSGVELLKRKTQIENEMPKADYSGSPKFDLPQHRNLKQDTSGNPNLYYPLFIDKITGKSREKRYKCSLCPSAFEKLDQYNVHITLHGSNYKYKCKLCDYSVKFYANFMMHIKRHKYHEKMDAQSKGLPPPDEGSNKYTPVIGINPAYEQSRSSKSGQLAEDKDKNKENTFDFNAYPDMTTVEKQQLLLQDKKPDSFKPVDEEKKVYYCQHCPYANIRRDAVDSHSLRHQANMGRGHYQCNFCDYTAAQPNFIREHTKVHFRPFKFVQPEGYMRHDKLEIWSINSSESVENDIPKKSLIFSHDEGVFAPEFSPENKSENNEINEFIDPNDESGIGVDFRSGDIVEAPSDFIIPLKPSKTKSYVSVGSSVTRSKSRRARKKTKLESPLTVLEDNSTSESPSQVITANHVAENSTDIPENEEDSAEQTVPEEVSAQNTELPPIEEGSAPMEVE